MPTITHTSHRIGARQATEKQIKFLLRLAGDRIFPQLGETGDARVAAIETLQGDGRLTGQTASRLIDALLRAPVDRAARQDERAQLTPGVYEVNGEIFNVKWNKTKTHTYATRLVEKPHVQRLTESGDTISIEFEYAPGAINTIRPHHKMTLERARELTIRYGRCLACGRTLKVADSVERGIGPVCRKAFRY